VKQRVKNISRLFHTLQNKSNYFTTIDKIEMDLLIGFFDMQFICNGKVRNIKFEKIQDNCYKVFSE